MLKNLPNDFYDNLYKDEKLCVEHLCDEITWNDNDALRVQDQACDLIDKLRSRKRKMGELESFLQQYGLNTKEGLALMTLAEALLRIPDAMTAHALIRDKIAAANWLGSLGSSKDWLTKAAGFGLMLTSKTLDGVFAKLGEPVIRESMVRAMQIMGRQFVLGTTIDEAIKNAEAYKHSRISYDMLGEGARTSKDAERYFQSYAEAIEAIARAPDHASGRKPGISVKLSALYPRYDVPSHEHCIPALSEKLLELCMLAARHNIALTVDAEESERLVLSMQIFENVLKGLDSQAWDGFGLAVQAYQKRALSVIDHIYEMSQRYDRRLQMRLVKGAYWDSEIKRAQIMGLSGYPVYTRKVNTDLSYLTCAQKMLSYADNIYPMFATHNAHTIAAVIDMGTLSSADFELQRLHGMGEGLYDVVHQEYPKVKSSVYAPVGPHSDLLAYLVRRLLENGANTSFVNKILDPKTPALDLASDPVQAAQDHETKVHPKISRPCDIYPDRRNSFGIDLFDTKTAFDTKKSILKWRNHQWYAGQLKSISDPKEGARVVMSPADPDHIVGYVHDLEDMNGVNSTFLKVKNGYKLWSESSILNRSDVLNRISNLLEKHHYELMALCVYEAGKTIQDAHLEIREAVDFCRYYAVQGQKILNENGQILPGPTGEVNTLYHLPRGIFVCISPWNFPCAIFIGQIVAALMAGNAVVAKPAEQTPLIAERIVMLMYEAGIPEDALQLVHGDGAVGAALVEHDAVDGVAFTGSSAAAKAIQRSLAAKDGAIVPLIAETGGQNALIADSSCLPEQLIDDVMMSAFGSAGQRCSALRVLYVQDDIADEVIGMLQGAMAEMRLEHPENISADFGPLIDAHAHEIMQEHQNYLDNIGQKIYKLSNKNNGYYFGACAYEVESIEQLKQEVFGPILHVIRFAANEVDSIIGQVNNTGFGLTFGVHSRIESNWTKLANLSKAGNLYINRSIIGAVVGTQPFGGCGLSGTGPKAGGPNYLKAFTTEKTVSNNVTASGGNTLLLNLEE